ncbi:unnamed protein product, partial [Schistosoma curassoni]|uniref:DUF6451 domain-containing protein n=1 Tax=Schistosoma curassoni TaxID=6186 RepID=A0A183KG05_9TREM
EKTNSVAVATAAICLNKHKGKSKILRYNTACNNPITIDGEDFEDVKTFTYLGSIIDEHGGPDADVKARIGKARAAYLQMKNIWNSKQLSTNTKVRIFNTNVNTVLLTKRICTTDTIEEEVMNVKKCLRNNGYPLKFIEKYGKREDKIPKETTVNNKPVFIQLKFKPGSNRQTFHHSMRLLTSAYTQPQELESTLGPMIYRSNA